MKTETKKRSWAKSLIWRGIGLILMPLIILLVGKFIGEKTGTIALWATIIFHGIRIVLYYLHERIWINIKWGLE